LTERVSIINEYLYEYETPITTALRGAFRTTQELDYKEDLINGLTNKHLEVYGK
jgi:hypothetical protein